jgi:hypothetical protein
MSAKRSDIRAGYGVAVVVIAPAHGGFIAAGGMLLLTLLGGEERDSGAASAVLNANQQVGSSLGTALLNTIYATAVTSYGDQLHRRYLPPTPAVQLEGLVNHYRVGFTWDGAILVVATVMVKAARRTCPRTRRPPTWVARAGSPGQG